MNTQFLLFIAVIAYLLFRYRRRLLVDDCPRLNFEAFEGEVYQVGETYVARRKAAKKPKQSIVCIHGFMEDMRYFTELYEDPHIELILVTNSGYYCPFSTKDLIQPKWAEPNPFLPYSIEYDAYALRIAVENLATTSKIKLHGHSRGGAVVLDAVRQSPAILGESEVVLEAAVLPQGKALFGRPVSLPTLLEWIFPISLGLMSKVPFRWYAGIALKPLSDRKKALLPGLWFNAKNQRVALENLRSMGDWTTKTDYSIYNNVKNGTFLIGQIDNVLDRTSMIDSAERAHDGFNIILTKGTTHFISLEEPKYARALAEKTVAVGKKKAKRAKGKSTPTLAEREVS